LLLVFIAAMPYAEASSLSFRVGRRRFSSSVSAYEILESILSTSRPHRILDVNPDADNETVKSAYLHLSSKFHPDQCKLYGAATAYKKINDAYEKMIKTAPKRISLDEALDQIDNIFEKLLDENLSFDERWRTGSKLRPLMLVVYKSNYSESMVSKK
jgi:hypothetical protein